MMFGAQSSSSAFATPSSTPAFGTPSTPAFGSSLFSTPFSQQSQPQQQQTPSLFQTPQQQQQTQPLFQTPQQQTPSLFQTPQPQQQQSPFGFTTPFNSAQQQQQPTLFNNAPSTNFMNQQLTTQMAPVAPLPFSLADRDIQAIVDAYKEEPGNLKYEFKHLLFSVTEPQYRSKPAGVSDIMWAESIAKLEGMESSKRERLWPQLVQGFKDLSQRLKLQDEVILSDSERLKLTQSNVKMLQRHFQADTLPWIQKMQQKEQVLQRRLLRAMRIIEALEGKGCRVPLMKGEVELAEKLAATTRQLKGSGAELSRRVQNLLMVSRLQADSLIGSSMYLPGSTKIHEQSLSDMQEVLQRQTEAIARLGNVLKRDVRDMEIIMAEDTDTEMTQQD
ncbi:nuclear pore complex protein NUP54-like isoform X1 [Salvia hispanica]|uniref:nuclear pore complex protein NUP54-like isoform X1 n=1 Tax=Salvia hispanica TaxID=49212 RepID=UPI0020090C30|nr:nuclear pore complex protein NUP54-like isoform X1 [Salvia hispanica]